MSDETTTDTARPAGPGPLVPRPVVTVIALVLVAGMFWHIWYDASRDTYDGGKVTIMLGAMILFTLGFDLGKWFRGGGAA